MDFRIDKEGEIFYDDMAVLNKNEYRVQMAESRLKSIKNDWYGDNIGANLEEMFGEYVSTELSSTLQEKIYTALTYDLFFSERDIYVEADVQETSMSVKAVVYIKDVNSNTTYKSLDLELDLFNGILE